MRKKLRNSSLVSFEKGFNGENVGATANLAVKQFPCLNVDSVRSERNLKSLNMGQLDVTLLSGKDEGIA